jgi:hypothetical protein
MLKSIFKNLNCPIVASSFLPVNDMDHNCEFAFVSIIF